MQYHSLLLGVDGGLWVCGHGLRGRLGAGSQDDCFLPTRVRDFYVEARKPRRPRRIGNNGLPLCLGYGQHDPLVTRTPYWPTRQGRLRVPAPRLPADMERELAVYEEAEVADLPALRRRLGMRKRGRLEIGDGKGSSGSRRSGGAGGEEVKKADRQKADRSKATRQKATRQEATRQKATRHEVDGDRKTKQARRGDEQAGSEDEGEQGTQGAAEDATTGEGGDKTGRKQEKRDGRVKARLLRALDEVIEQQAGEEACVEELLWHVESRAHANLLLVRLSRALPSCVMTRVIGEAVLTRVSIAFRFPGRRRVIAYSSKQAGPSLSRCPRSLFPSVDPARVAQPVLQGERGAVNAPFPPRTALVLSAPPPFRLASFVPSPTAGASCQRRSC